LRDQAVVPLTRSPPRAVLSGGFPLVPDALDIVRRPLAMLARLVDERGRDQLDGLELAHRESIEPRFLAARQAVNLRAPHVPQLDIHAVRAALTEEENRH